MARFEQTPWLDPLTVRIRHTEGAVSNEVRRPKVRTKGLELVVECPHDSFNRRDILSSQNALQSLIDSAQRELDESNPQRYKREKMVQRVARLRRVLQTAQSHARALAEVRTIRELMRRLNEHAENHRHDLVMLKAQLDAEQGKEHPIIRGDPTGLFDLETYRREFDSLEKRLKDLHSAESDKDLLSALNQKILLFKDPVEFRSFPIQNAAIEQTHLIHDLTPFRRNYDSKRAEALRQHFVGFLQAMGFYVH